MDEMSVKELQKETSALGILNIEASDELTSSCVKDAIDVVKSLNLDFHHLAEEAKRKRSNPLK